MIQKKREYSAEGIEKIRLNGFNQWLRNAIKKHGDRFDYSKSLESFKTQKFPSVNVRCNKHNEWFEVTPFNHLRSVDGCCRECELETTGKGSLEREQKKFFDWFEKNRSNELEMKSQFSGMTTNMEFYCKKHKSITATKPTYLMNVDAYGCEKCSREATKSSGLLTLERARNDLEMDFPDHVKIIDVVFDEEKKQSFVQIICDIHGKQNVSKGTLKRSYYKCPKCGDDATGYTGNRLRNLVENGEKGRATFLGVMEVKVFDIVSLKVGVTTRTLEDRYKWHLKKVHFSVQMSEVDAYVLENKIHRHFNKHHDLRILKAGMRNKERWAGDTECYWVDRKDDIINYIKVFFENVDDINYHDEVDVYEIPNFFPRDKSREKSEANKPVPIVGIDPVSNLVVKEYPSLSAAIEDGYSNLSTVIYNKNNRTLAGGLRWFKKSQFDPNNIPPLPKKNIKTTKVKCLETGIVYESIKLAEEDMRSKGFRVSGSKISAVCGGKRKHTSGFTWAYIE